MGGGKKSEELKQSVQISVWDVASKKEHAHPVETIPVVRLRSGYSEPVNVLARNGKFVLRSLYLSFQPAAPAQQHRIGTRLTVIDTSTGVAGKPVEYRDRAVYVVESDPLSPDGRTIALTEGTDRTQVHLVDMVTGKERIVLGGLRRPLQAFAFSPDGRLAAGAAGFDGSNEVAAPSEVMIWDVATGKEVVRMIDKDTVRDYTAIRFSPDSRVLVAQDRNGELFVWGQLPKSEPVKSPGSGSPAQPAPAEVPDRFQTLLRDLAADGVTDQRRVECVFLAALGRLPTDVEARALATQLARQTDKAAALRDLLTTLTDTAEFKAHADALRQLVK